VANSKALPTASFQFDSGALPDERAMVERFGRLAGHRILSSSTVRASRLLCSAIQLPRTYSWSAMRSNWGFLPIGGAAVERAIEINGASVGLNLRAFRYGRVWALDPGLLEYSSSHPAGARQTLTA